MNVRKRDDSLARSPRASRVGQPSKRVKLWSRSHAVQSRAPKRVSTPSCVGGSKVSKLLVVSSEAQLWSKPAGSHAFLSFSPSLDASYYSARQLKQDTDSRTRSHIASVPSVQLSNPPFRLCLSVPCRMRSRLVIRHKDHGTPAISDHVATNTRARSSDTFMQTREFWHLKFDTRPSYFSIWVMAARLKSARRQNRFA